MAKKTKIISIVSKEWFRHRVVTHNTEMGEYLYDLFIGILESCGEEIEHGYPDLLFFSQVESNHETRKFAVSTSLFKVFHSFKMSGREAFDKYAKHNIEQGKKVLFMLNSGQISLKDFEKEQEL